MITIDRIKEVYPSNGSNGATTGLIPMAVFDVIESLLRPAMRAAGIRAIYRGARKSNKSNNPSMTRRCDATHVLLYRM